MLPLHPLRLLLGQPPGVVCYRCGRPPESHRGQARSCRPILGATRHCAKGERYLPTFGLHNDREDILPLHPLGPTTSSPHTFKLANLWLDKCLNNHSECTSRFTPGDRLPTRLIEIRTHDPKRPKSARLRWGATLPTGTTYVTLSHCWGVERFLTLTTQNEAHMMNEVPLDALAIKFRDAIEITSGLGFGYLWIDSLCILQDSPEDWGAESARMAQVFEHSALTIAATCSPSASFGCFAKRPAHSDSCLLPEGASSILDGKASWLTTQKKEDAFWLENVESHSLPLQMRGWTLQERLLSPRILYFSNDGIFWECNKVCASEIWHSHNRTPKQWISLLKIPPTISKKMTISWHELWITLLVDYSQRLLSYPDRDKLVAVSGIAKAFQNLLRERYFAGLWEGDMLRALCWQKSYSPDTSPMSPEALLYRAPSWSWASVDGKLEFDLRWYKSPKELRYLAEIKHVEADLATEDPMGQLKGGSIKLMGFPMHLLVYPNSAIPADTCNGWLKCVWDKRFQNITWDREPTRVTYPRNLWCLPIVHRSLPNSGTLNHIFCLLLEPADPESETPNKFYRVGLLAQSNFLSKYQWELEDSREITII
ncbi:uncharacterized protein K452DRAFT_42686 [Aplosporella prunicola CBS 121167]|uniref:Heterokaryon incompatibility domain-containing protein n=1 Tax=Aplosporella prunicola CBS 121167 TaxID=1176127 RepID=A0A6A6BA54_9PEZI|nr:uncharacterized protein K452DRAFT_42686 [Aplosporella prunicola CBS 121167]KAF2140906.1 hypothetical protein K452DRAFT_42686 [Aplosporella prunicola CBS 121167]